MRSIAFVLVVCLATALLLVAAAQAGKIDGVVVDVSGAAIPGARVQLTRPGVAPVFTVTDSVGRFEFPNVDAGPCELVVDLAGFRRVQRPCALANGQRVNLSVTLEVGTVAETVTVTRATPKTEARQMAAAPMDAVAAGVAGRVAGNTVGGMRRFVGPLNTESYDKIDDGAWKAVGDDPLSTFSIDVDTASYANVRRFLTSGSLPPPDAVRIEELINYFTFAYPQPQRTHPFSVTTEVAACPWNNTHALVLVGLQGQRLDEARLPPRNLVFLIDVSGSMNEPAKLPLVQSSLRLLADQLTSRDRLAMVVYAGASGLVLPPTSGDDKSTIRRAIDSLHSGGSTNGGAGIQLAYDVAARELKRNGINRVILATDGDFNVGVTNQGELIRLIEQKRETGIALSVLGFGTGNLKDATMEKLADRGNGNYAYIDSLSEAQKVLVSEAGGTLVTIAKDVKLQVEFNPAVVSSYRLIGYENRALANADFHNDKKDAGEMGAGHSVTALYEIVLVGRQDTRTGSDAGAVPVGQLRYQGPRALTATANADELMSVNIRFKRPTSERSELMSQPVRRRRRLESPGGNTAFAASVAAFGMLLRDSEHKGEASFPMVLGLARAHRGDDLHGHRGEFIKLVELAQTLAAQHESRHERPRPSR